MVNHPRSAYFSTSIIALLEKDCCVLLRSFHLVFKIFVVLHHFMRAPRTIQKLERKWMSLAGGKSAMKVPADVKQHFLSRKGEHLTYPQ